MLSVLVCLGYCEKIPKPGWLRSNRPSLLRVLEAGGVRPGRHHGAVGALSGSQTVCCVLPRWEGWAALELTARRGPAACLVPSLWGLGFHRRIFGGHIPIVALILSGFQVFPVYRKYCVGHLCACSSAHVSGFLTVRFRAQPGSNP